MKGEVREEQTAVEVTRDYAAEECVGEWGAVTDVQEDDETWIVEFETHTYSDEYEHRLKINRAGNVFAHERRD